MGLYFNGNVFSHASAEISFKGKVYRGISSITYSAELERELVYGTGSEPLGVTRGVYKPTGEIEMLSMDADRLLKDMGDGPGEQSISVVISYREPSSVRVDTLETCFITKVEDSSQQGPSANKTKLTLMIAEVMKRGGNGLIKSPDRPRVAIRP
jgi:hypothetical protein